MGLSWKYQKDSSKYYINYTFTDPLTGQSPAFFRWSIYLGLEHEFFNGVNYLPGNPTFPTEAELYWEFFKQVVSGATTPIFQNAALQSLKLKVYPVPATDKVTIELANSGVPLTAHYQLFNTQGQIVYSFTSPGSIIQLSKNQLPEGIYLLKVQQGNTITSKLICFQ